MAGQLAQAGRVAILPHQNADGDALGAAVALALGLSSVGKQADVLLEEPIQARMFADWSMGFRHLSDADVQKIEGYNPFMRQTWHRDSITRDDTTGCLEILRFFRDSR